MTFRNILRPPFFETSWLPGTLPSWLSSSSAYCSFPVSVTAPSFLPSLDLGPFSIEYITLDGFISFLANALPFPANVTLSPTSPSAEMTTPSFQPFGLKMLDSTRTARSYAPTPNLVVSHCLPLQDAARIQPLLTSSTATTLTQAAPGSCLLTIPPTVALTHPHPPSILYPTARVTHLKPNSDHDASLCKTFSLFLI